MIQEIDWSVGEVMKALKRFKLDDNTLVIFTSDSGLWLSYGNHAGSAEPFREGKGTCWEGGTREPCIMRWPGKIPKGQTSDAMLMTIDLLPTIAHFTGATLPTNRIDGLDVRPLITGAKGATNPHEGYAFYYENNQLQAVTSGDGRWKLQLPHTYRTLTDRLGGKDGIPAKYQQAKILTPELFDLRNDPGETKDAASAQPEVVARLLAFAETTRANLGDSLRNQRGAGNREAGRITRTH